MRNTQAGAATTDCFEFSTKLIADSLLTMSPWTIVPQLSAQRVYFHSKINKHRGFCKFQIFFFTTDYRIPGIFFFSVCVSVSCFRSFGGARDFRVRIIFFCSLHKTQACYAIDAIISKRIYHVFIFLFNVFNEYKRHFSIKSLPKLFILIWKLFPHNLFFYFGHKLH